MKKRYAILPAVLIAVLVMMVYGQHNHSDMIKTDKMKHDMSKMMGKPTLDAKVEGLHMKVWLMTQKQHKKMMDKKMGGMMKKDMKHDSKGMKDTSMAMGMKGMKHEGMEMDKATKEAMMAGTHHIMLVVTDAANGKEIPDAKANVMIMSPSAKHSSVNLKVMMGHYGGGLTFDEKGKYQLTVDVTIGGVSKTKEFTYLVK